MGRGGDGFGLLDDRELQLATLRSGWRFYERVASTPDAEAALTEWVSAFAAVLDLRGSAADLLGFRAEMTRAAADAKSDRLKETIRRVSGATRRAAIEILRSRAAAKSRGPSSGVEEATPIAVERRPVATGSEQLPLQLRDEQAA